MDRDSYLHRVLCAWLNELKGTTPISVDMEGRGVNTNVPGDYVQKRKQMKPNSVCVCAVRVSPSLLFSLWEWFRFVAFWSLRYPPIPSQRSHVQQ